MAWAYLPICRFGVLKEEAMSEPNGDKVVSVHDLDVAEKVSIAGAEAPLKDLDVPEETKEKRKKAPREKKKEIVHGGGAAGGKSFGIFLSIPNHVVSKFALFYFVWKSGALFWTHGAESCQGQFWHNFCDLQQRRKKSRKSQALV